MILPHLSLNCPRWWTAFIYQLIKWDASEWYMPLSCAIGSLWLFASNAQLLGEHCQSFIQALKNTWSNMNYIKNMCFACMQMFCRHFKLHFCLVRKTVVLCGPAGTPMKNSGLHQHLYCESLINTIMIKQQNHCGRVMVATLLKNLIGRCWETYLSIREGAPPHWQQSLGKSKNPGELQGWLWTGPNRRPLWVIRESFRLFLYSSNEFFCHQLLLIWLNTTPCFYFHFNSIWFN